MDIKDFGKQVNISLKYDDIILVDKLKRLGLIKGYTEIFKVGLKKLQEDSVELLMQNNNS